jgi:hypothetical protein
MCGAGWIDWCGFTWEAFATLATGLAAVSAAVVVGRKQAEIQMVQAGLQSMALKSDLFDRRYSVFERAERFLQEAIRLGSEQPGTAGQDFLVAMGESRFLFEPAVELGLREIWAKWCEFQGLKAAMKSTFASEGHYGDGNPAKESAALMLFAERLTSLPELFAEMRLS